MKINHLHHLEYALWQQRVAINNILDDLLQISVSDYDNLPKDVDLINDYISIITGCINILQKHKEMNNERIK
jgi:hypothetical protein